jgi:hypothetical protein
MKVERSIPGALRIRWYVVEAEAHVIGAYEIAHIGDTVG